jgi:hypothetical protein
MTGCWQPYITAMTSPTLASVPQSPSPWTIRRLVRFVATWYLKRHLLAFSPRVSKGSCCRVIDGRLTRSEHPLIEGQGCHIEAATHEMEQISLVDEIDDVEDSLKALIAGCLVVK